MNGMECVCMPIGNPSSLQLYNYIYRQLYNACTVCIPTMIIIVLPNNYNYI